MTIKIGDNPNVAEMLLKMAKESPEMTLSEAMQNIQENLADEEASYLADKDLINPKDY